jgi:hypothetical protein
MPKARDIVPVAAMSRTAAAILCDHFYLALAVWREARGESAEGQVAVACSIINRVANPKWWGATVDEVITKRWQYCVVPQARILLADLSWVSAAGIKKGDRLIGFGEELTRATTFQESFVEATGRLSLPCYELVTDRGIVVVSEEHAWCARKHPRGHRRTPLQWIATHDLRGGDRIKFFCEPWEYDTSYEAGYLAGFFDGEGFVVKQTGGVGYGQKSGLVQKLVSKLLRSKGFDFVERFSGGVIQGRLRTRNGQGLRFLGTIRPQRLLEKSDILWVGKRGVRRPGTPYAVVSSIREVGVQEVVSIRTSTRTMLVEGMFSHNSSLTDPKDPQVSRSWPTVKDPSWLLALGVAHDVLEGGPVNPMPGADSYHDSSIAPPFWTAKARKCGTIGKLTFYDVDLDYEKEKIT